MIKCMCTTFVSVQLEGNIELGHPIFPNYPTSLQRCEHMPLHVTFLTAWEGILASFSMGLFHKGQDILLQESITKATFHMTLWWVDNFHLIAYLNATFLLHRHLICCSQYRPSDPCNISMFNGNSYSQVNIPCIFNFFLSLHSVNWIAKLDSWMVHTFSASSAISHEGRRA